MTIRASSAAEVERLVANLRDPNGTEREAAVARLRILGARALSRVTPLVLDDTASAAARVAALQALEDLDDARARDAALAAAASLDRSVATAALTVLRPWIRRDDGVLVDRLTRLSLDEQRPDALRAAILALLAELHGTTVTPLQERLRTPSAPSPDRLSFPRDSNLAREWLGSKGEVPLEVPLSVLHDFVIHAKQQEQSAESLAGQDAWRNARAMAHATLAARDSTVALYDLRDTFAEATVPLPLDFLTAISSIGDASCLEPMAQAWASAPTETWWRDRLSAAAADVVKRARLSGRSAIVKRVRARFPGFV